MGDDYHFNLVISFQDYRPNAKSGKGSSDDNLSFDRKNLIVAPTSTVIMDKNIPILQSNENKEYDGATSTAAEFAGDINDNKGINTNFNGAKHSLSKDVKICQTLAKSCINKITPRGAGWGTPTGLGLRGGGETSVANGATGWGPPPQTNTSVTRGWGQPQTTNTPTANGISAWGNAVNSTASNSAGMNLTY